jgi:hypothetical protein
LTVVRIRKGAPLVEQLGKSLPGSSESSEVLFAKTCAAFAFLLIAILYTVMLVFASRRATLRHVNANLMEIAQQLKQLQQSLGNSAARSQGAGKGE